jgi:hypothetical protein
MRSGHQRRFQASRPVPARHASAVMPIPKPGARVVAAAVVPCVCTGVAGTCPVVIVVAGTVVIVVVGAVVFVIAAVVAAVVACVEAVVWVLTLINGFLSCTSTVVFFEEVSPSRPLLSFMPFALHSAHIVYVPEAPVLSQIAPVEYELDVTGISTSCVVVPALLVTAVRTAP